MQPDQLLLVALFQEPQPRSLALQRVIDTFEFQYRAHACKRIGHDSDDGAVAQAFNIDFNPDAPAVLLWDLDFTDYRYRIEQFPHLLRLQNRRNAHLTAESRPFDEQRRVIRNGLLYHQPVE